MGHFWMDTMYLSRADELMDDVYRIQDCTGYLQLQRLVDSSSGGGGDGDNQGPGLVRYPVP